MGVLTREGETDGLTDWGHGMALAAAVAPPLPPSPRSKSSRDCPPQLSPKSILLLLMNLMTEERQQQNNHGISLDVRIVYK